LRVLNGRFEGKTGMVVGIDGTKAIVLNDGTKDKVSQRIILSTIIRFDFSIRCGTNIRSTNMVRNSNRC
jgi:hypothetical protein